MRPCGSCLLCFGWYSSLVSSVAHLCLIVSRFTLIEAVKMCVLIKDLKGLCRTSVLCQVTLQSAHVWPIKKVIQKVIHYITICYI